MAHASILLEPTLDHSRLNLLVPAVVLAIEYQSTLAMLGEIGSDFTETREDFNVNNSAVQEFISLTNQVLPSARVSLQGSYERLDTQIKVKANGNVEVDFKNVTTRSFCAEWDPDTDNVTVKSRAGQTMSWRTFVLMNTEIGHFRDIINGNA